MIDHLDNVLRHLFMSQVESLKPPSEPVSEAQIGFQPPDEQWRGHVSGLTPKKALNVYLADLRENRKLRSNKRVRSFENGLVNETPAPRRMDCHYLITAWSPADSTQAVEPTLDEHILLYEVTGVLMNSEPLMPRQVYKPDPLPAGFPEVIADEELPTTILPVEGFPKLAEFWGTMGVNYRWKPVIYLVVTIPVVLRKEVAGPMVTTRITEYRQIGSDTSEVWIQIGGHVWDASDPLPDGSPKPVPGAWVALEESGTGEPLQTTNTKDKDEEVGRFSFGMLKVGQYRLRARATGLGELTRDVQVPSPSGEYDLSFS